MPNSINFFIMFMLFNLCAAFIMRDYLRDTSRLDADTILKGLATNILAIMCLIVGIIYSLIEGLTSY